jgi:glycosyltransferase involved in cell wall biosynthesis
MEPALKPAVAFGNGQSRRLRVCHVFANTEGGTWMFEQLRELRDQHGFDVAAVISGDRGPLVDRLRSANIPFYVANFEANAGAPDAVVKLPLGILALARLLRRERFDIVQTHVFKSMVLGRPSAWLADAPIRLAMVAGPFHLEARSSRWIERLTYWMDTQIIPSCEKSRDLLLGLGISEKRVAPTIYYGPDEKLFDVDRIEPANLRAEFGWPAETPVICHIAYFYPRMPQGKWIPEDVQGRGIKGHEELVRAAAIVVKEFPQAKFVLVGRAFGAPGEEFLAEVKSLVRELDLESTVLFSGFRDDPNRVLRDADVSVQPSLSENCGGSFEALLMESPLVATRVGGLVDPVKDNETGILVRPADPEDLARGILDMLRDPLRARAMGRAGRELMLQRFTLSHTVNDLARLYHKLSSDVKSRRRYNPLVSAFRLLVGAPIFAYMAFRMIVIDIYLPIYFQRVTGRLKGLALRAYYLTKWRGLVPAYTAFRYARIPFYRGWQFLTGASDAKRRLKRRT